MEIKQFEDKNLSHFSYAVLSNCAKQIIVIDPSRNIEGYLLFAKEKEAKIIGIVETHAHADFVSGHLEMHEITNAPIYVSKLLKASYTHISFDESQKIEFGKIKLTAINTPGHSPDSICIILEHDGKRLCVFTGDTLFVGDCGRPDLREDSEDLQTSKEILAVKMYNSLQFKLKLLEDELTVYPAHGAGSLCGKALGSATSSTIGKEKETNWSLQSISEEDFVKTLLSDQPFVPAYFPFVVKLNIKGAPPFKDSVDRVLFDAIKTEDDFKKLNNSIWIIDARNQELYKKGHLVHSINIMNEIKFETWLGTILNPDEAFYLLAETEAELKQLIERSAAIGYESNIKKSITATVFNETSEILDVDYFKQHLNDFTIIDVRDKSEVEDQQVFPNSLSIPLAELRNRANHIPTNKPLVVHCASGFRSAAGSSLLQSILKDKVKVFDLSDAVKDFLRDN